MYEIHIGPYGLAKYFITFFFFFFSVLLVEGNKEELHRIFHFIFLGNALFDQKLIFFFFSFFLFIFLIFLGNALFEFDQKIGSFLKAVLH